MAIQWHSASYRTYAISGASNLQTNDALSFLPMTGGYPCKTDLIADISPGDICSTQHALGEGWLLGRAGGEV